MREKQHAEKLRTNPNQDHREESTDTHSASWWRRVTSLAGLVLISSVLLGSQAVAKDLAPHPDKNCTYKNNHDYIPPKVKGKQPLPPCNLWKSVVAACIKNHDKQWSNHHWCYNKGDKKIKKHVKPPVAIVKEEKCHFMAVPTKPVIGVEDAHHRDKYPYWTYAWDAGTEPAPYPKEIKRHLFKRIGLAVNPRAHRTQHQLHIHIGKVPPDIRGPLLKHLPNHGKWSKIITIKGKNCAIKFIRGTTVPKVFKEVSKHAGESKMKDLGIILAGHVDTKGNLDGFIILSCDNACVEKWLNYQCGHH